MSFKENSFQQLSLLDSYSSMTKREKRFLDKSWACDFADIVFPAIQESRFSVLYANNQASRPNTPVNVSVGALILKEMFSLTDEELLECILFDVRYRYALHTTGFQEQPVSDRTFSRFRERLYLYEQESGIDLLKQEMMALADVFVRFLNISHETKRMDSLMVASSCKKMSRLELFYICNEKAVLAVQRMGGEEFLKGLESYLKEGTRNDILYRCKKEQVAQRLEKCIEDSHLLIERIGDGYDELPEYQNLKRLLSEQLKPEDGLQLREYTELSSQALYNPSDPDATIRMKRGEKNVGYVGHLVETLDENGSIITQYDYRPNIHGDQSFCRDTLSELEKKEIPVTLIADGGYYGLDLIKEAEKKNIELITTGMIGRKPDPIYADFELNEEGRICRCAGGQVPKRSSYNQEAERTYAVFDREKCLACEYRERCRVIIRKSSSSVDLERSKIERARYLKKLSEEAYQRLQRRRNGVEGLPSVLRRRYQVDKMPVRGYLRTKIWFSLKVGAMNIRKLVKWNAKRKRKEEGLVFC